MSQGDRILDVLLSIWVAAAAFAFLALCWPAFMDVADGVREFFRRRVGR